MFNKIFKHKILDSNKPVEVIGLNKTVQTNYVWNLLRESKKNILVITSNLYQANLFFKELSFYDEEKVLFFPVDDFIASEILASSPELLTKRIETLNNIINSSVNKIIITNLVGYLRFMPSKTLWQSSYINLKVNDSINRENLLEKLFSIGYEKSDLVTKTGEYSNRGYILDIFPYGFEKPIRIEFFDDEIEDIREFDYETQLSSNKLSTVKIKPFTEFINEKNIEDIPNRQSLLPRVVNEVSSIKDYMGDYITLFIDYEQIEKKYETLIKETLDYSETDNYKLNKYMHDLYEITPKSYVDIKQTDNYSISNSTEKYESKEIEKFNSNFDKLRTFIKKEQKSGKKIIVYLETDNLIARFKEDIILDSVITNIDNLFDDNINIIKGKIYGGFAVENYVFISSSEIYGRERTAKFNSRFRYGTKINNINKLEIGDYVVHSAFGIGRYLGIKTMNVKNLKKDFLYLQYKDDDKLYVPVEKIEFISKYSSNEGAVPRLSKLGGTDWVKQKAKVKAKVVDIAKDLLMVSAKRKMLNGFSFLEDDEDQYKFENEFEYTETPDQLKAINEIKKDMEKPYPMDRLLCGDVGYGKTEVAFRAAFKAIKSGKQVAILCPTTILSKQHYENAKKRFQNYGINIDVLNRFVTNKNKERILEDIKNGKTDLIIGTHRLLSKDIVYKDLGLLIIDEEQRFGVTHKEKIKQIKETIDVLTLSATPIPRTLQMSLSGVRGLSLIETPPAYRYPIQTYVLRENDQVLKDAIYKELSRNGQAFVLYNNIQFMDEKISKIKKLVPEAKICIVHGQMDKTEIEKTMEAFVNKEYDVMLCTTIIETGIDIENVNTIVIYDADCFGLSQLYQIRGRIGRGKNIGYAYLMYDKRKELNDIAVKRLNAIKEFTELGSGYALALRDLSIRGAGDILGAEQSGFIDSVGYDMYLKILNEEIERLKGNVVIDDSEEKYQEKPFIQVSTHIDEKYTIEENLIIEIHKLINTIDSYERFEEVKKELKDRFGQIDETMENYMLEELFQALCKKKEVLKVEELKDKVIVYFPDVVAQRQNGAKLLTNLFKINNNFNIRYLDKMLKIELSTRNLKNHFLNYLIEMLDIIE